MNRIKVLILVTLMLCSVSSFGQSRSETKNYNKAILKNSLKLYEKFLDKYPKSIYNETIMYKRDSMIFNALDTTSLVAYEGFITNYPKSEFRMIAQAIVTKMNTSTLSTQDVENVVWEHLTKEVDNMQYRASALRINNIEHIFCVVLNPNFRESRTMRVYMLKKEDTWKLVDTIEQEIYYQSGRHLDVVLGDDFKIINIKGNRLIHFDYEMSSSKSDYVELVTNLFDVQNLSVYSAMFAGREFEEKLIENRSLIEGESMDAASQAYRTPEMDFLLNYLNELPYLKIISKDNLLVDQAIEWWYKENANAKSSIKFGLLPSDNLLVKEFNRSKDVIISRNNNVVLMDIRGYSVICTYNRNSKEYSLVWCEKLPKDRKKDKLLNSIYFENTNSLVLYYYKGRTTFKVRVNLATKKVTY